MPKGKGFTVVEVFAVLIILGAVTMVSYLAIPILKIYQSCRKPALRRGQAFPALLPMGDGFILHT